MKRWSNIQVLTVACLAFGIGYFIANHLAPLRPTAEEPAPVRTAESQPPEPKITEPRVLSSAPVQAPEPKDPDAELQARFDARHRVADNGKSALRDEYKKLTDYLSKQEFPPIDTAYQQAIVDLLRETKAYTAKSYLSPYDPPPQPANGDKLITEALTANLADCQAASQRFAAAAAQKGL